MSDIQDKINEILSNPEALKQVQSLGEQLGLNKASTPQLAPPPVVEKPQQNNLPSSDMMGMVTKLAPLLNSFKGEDDATRLLNSLKPFLSYERRQRLEKAEKMFKLIRVMPMLRDNGIF